MVTLPLFPLGTVLLPGSRLPLRVFEPRYIDLLRNVLRAPEASREFGVVAIRRGHEVGADAVRELYDMGCAARIEQLRRSDGGAFGLVARGTRRFRLDGLAREGTSYLTGLVTWLDEEEAEGGRPAGLVAAEGAWIGRLLTAHGATRGERPVVPDDPDALCELVVRTVSLALSERQSILAAGGIEARLARVAELLQREVGLAKALGDLSGAFTPDPPSLN